jgi:hypothetical protein
MIWEDVEDSEGVGMSPFLFNAGMYGLITKVRKVY